MGYADSANTAGHWRAQLPSDTGANAIPGSMVWEPGAPSSKFEKFIDKVGDVAGEVLYRAQGIPGEGLLVGGIAGSLSKAKVVAAEGPVIIGETMARVEAAASKIPGSKILNDMPDFKALGMNATQVTSAMMEYNRKWILEQLRSGRQIIDLGLDPNRGIPSIFYQMEQNMMKNYMKLQQTVK